MTTISIRGAIAPEEWAWFYELLGMACTTPEQFRAQLDAAEDDVVVEINSPGGVVVAAAEIYEAIRAFPGDIECRVVGQAASAASVIACAARNSITPMGTLFLHNCIGSAEGNHNDMRQAAQAMESVDENIMEAYRAKTGLPDSRIYRLMERNTTLSAVKAVEYGFIDKITESAACAAQAAGPVSGIAAGAAGFIDPTAMDAERLMAMRRLYEQSKLDCIGGGEEMENENTETVTDEVQAEEVEAAEVQADEPEAADEPEGDEAQAADEPEDDEAQACEAEEGIVLVSADEIDAAYERGVRAERERVAGILDIAASVPEEMLRAALFTEPVSAEALALRAMRAEAAARGGYMELARADALASGASEVLADVADGDGCDVLDKAKALLREKNSK